MQTNPSSRRRSIGLAAVIAVALAVWIASGLGGGLPETDETAATTDETGVRVTVRRSKSEPMERTITASARTQPNRYVELKAETEGRVISVDVRRGAVVRAGEAIATLDMRDRNSRLEEAQALIRQRELEFEAATRLRADGYMSAADLAAAEALLVGARAQEERINLDIARTRIVAPFDAVVYDRAVEVGDYVAIGDPIAELVDNDPMYIVANINERDIGGLAVGSDGVARVLSGPEIPGTISYLAPVADESTRSFRVELSVRNPDNSLKAGTSAELILGAEYISAHTISAGLLALADDGNIGVMVVDSANRARFMAIELAETSAAGVQATGLPDEITLITVGQGFVVDGQRVIPVEETAAASEAPNERTH